ncbi:MAG TPA: PHB depolymerase family esterase [Phycisphaerae bacterium]|nr:PHB depolymerase family esterase [Phycisphaerae bacterium]HRY71483.1 PHB depolymerase family esterase [Phycisphaerae bacterium]HSA30049.1 PHB depolymerase family esterase [Phycisphaerae bacterium]
MSRLPNTAAVAAVVLGAAVVGQGHSIAYVDPAVDEVTRAGRGPVKLYVPDGYDPLHPAPLLLALHGAGGRGEELAGIASMVDEKGFLYAHPDGGCPSGSGLRWCYPEIRPPDDPAYLRALIEAIAAQYSVNPNRVFIYGISSGGMMAYSMACRYADVITAIAVFTGRIRETECRPGDPVHVLHIHGTMDTLIYQLPWLATTPYNLWFWAESNGCAPTCEGARPGCADTADDPCDASLGRLDLVAALPGEETVITRWAEGCATTGVVELWAVLGAGHPGVDPKWTTSDYELLRRLAVNWLLAHPADCNRNGKPDDEDIADGTSRDCNGNLIPDECEPGGVEVAKADFNRDCHVDMTDFWVFEACANGPTLPYASGCALIPDGEGFIAADFDGDRDVDQNDFGVFQRCYSGPGQPADPDCTE